jgi:hypothetical protein
VPDPVEREPASDAERGRAGPGRPRARGIAAQVVRPQLLRVEHEHSLARQRESVSAAVLLKRDDVNGAVRLDERSLAVEVAEQDPSARHRDHVALLRTGRDAPRRGGWARQQSVGRRTRNCAGRGRPRGEPVRLVLVHGNALGVGGLGGPAEGERVAGAHESPEQSALAVLLVGARDLARMRPGRLHHQLALQEEAVRGRFLAHPGDPLAGERKLVEARVEIRADPPAAAQDGPTAAAGPPDIEEAAVRRYGAGSVCGQAAERAGHRDARGGAQNGRRLHRPCEQSDCREERNRHERGIARPATLD